MILTDFLSGFIPLSFSFGLLAGLAVFSFSFMFIQDSAFNAAGGAAPYGLPAAFGRVVVGEIGK